MSMTTAELCEMRLCVIENRIRCVWIDYRAHRAQVVGVVSKTLSYAVLSVHCVNK